MKKITLLLFTILSTSVFAQITNLTGLPGADLIYHEDGRFTTNAGYTFTDESGTASLSTNSTTPADDAEAGYTRPLNNYPVETAASYTANVRNQSTSGSSNVAAATWIVINSVDLSAYDAGSKYFTIVTLSKFFENGGTNIDDQNVFYYRNSDTGDDPTTGASWTEVPSGLISNVGSTGVFGADAVWAATQIDLSGITCGTNFAIAIKRTTSADGPNPGETLFSSSTNRNGTMWLSSQVYTGSTTPLSVEDDMLKEAISVYPNPTKNVINIKTVNQSIQVKKVDLIDLSGKLIYSKNDTNLIDVKGFSTGIYVLKIQSQDGGELNKKIVIN